MNIQQIQYVLAVKELRHFELAAEKCFVSQSTLSTMIRKFEDEIQIKIFDRKTKPVEITKEGNDIIDQLYIIQKEIENLEENVKLLKGELSGQFKIGIIPTVAPYILPKFLGDLAKEYPRIHFSISELTTETIISKLKKRELDAGILALPINEPDLLEYPLYNEEFVLYDCCSGTKKDPIELDEINYDYFWLLEEGHCLANQVTKICNLDKKKSKVTNNFEFKAGSIDSLIRFVKESNGNTMLPYLATLDFLAADKNNLSYFKKNVPVRNVGILIHQHFVKKPILNLLEITIKEKILPLLKNNNFDTTEVISPEQIPSDIDQTTYF
ncbi:LysR substrate-binding domain-containing protein [Flagellimonas sp. 2504JD4-2]